MKITTLVALVLGLAVVASNASAHDEESGWRVGAAAVTTKLKRDDNLVNDTGLGYKFFGQYRFNSWVGFEGTYYNSGELASDAFSAGGSQVDIVYKGFQLQGIGYIPLPVEELDFFVKGGFFDLDVDSTTDGANGGRGSDSGIVVGTGFSLHILDNLHARTEFDWYDAASTELWNISLGLEYHF